MPVANLLTESPTTAPSALLYPSKPTKSLIILLAGVPGVERPPWATPSWGILVSPTTSALASCAPP